MTRKSIEELIRAQIRRPRAEGHLLVNFFTPGRKLIREERVGAKVKKIYDRAQTPYRWVLALGEIGEEEKAKLREAYLELNPVEIRRRMEENLRKLWGLNG